MRTPATAAVTDEVLLLSRSPAAEVAAAALQAKDDAGLERADIVVVACAPGTAGAVKELVDRALESA